MSSVFVRFAVPLDSEEIFRNTIRNRNMYLRVISMGVDKITQGSCIE